MIDPIVDVTTTKQMEVDILNNLHDFELKMNPLEILEAENAALKDIISELKCENSDMQDKIYRKDYRIAFLQGVISGMSDKKGEKI